MEEEKQVFGTRATGWGLDKPEALAPRHGAEGTPGTAYGQMARALFGERASERCGWDERGKREREREREGAGEGQRD